MLFKSKLHLVSALSIAFLVLLSFSGNHPAGNTGAPGDGICSNCHGGGGGGFDGTIDIDGLPSIVEPGTVYNITMTLNVSQGTPIRGGFQVVSLLDGNDNQAGDWFNNSGGSSLVVSGGREYFGHSPAQNFGGGSSISWTCDWVPPSVADDVTFYAVGNLANGSGSSGDKIITNTLTVTVEPPVALDISFTNIEDVSCFGEEDGSALAEATGGSAPYDFLWDNGENSALATMLAAGSRTVTVTDNDGNSTSASVTIGSPSEIQINPGVDNVTCFGEEDGFVDLAPSGGVGDYECVWSDGIDDCVRDGLSGGLYFITISDADGCTNVFDIEIEEPNMLELNLSVIDESAAGNDGSITSTPTGGTSPYQFDWSNGVQEFGQSSTIDGLMGGNYGVTVTDQNDCQEEAMVTVGSLACMLDATASISNIQCFGDSTGVISTNVTGANDPVSYLWSDGSTSAALTDVPAGIYSVVITDASNCEIILDQLVVSQSDELLVNVLSVNDASCEDSADGSIILNVFGGDGEYDLSWSNGVMNDTTIVQGDTLINIPDTLTNLALGTYTYTLLDGNLCVKTDSIVIQNGDEEDPVLVLQQGTVYLDSMGQAPAATFDLVDAGSTDNCGIDSVAFMTPAFTCADIESFDFQVELFDAAGNSTRGFATINVVDTIGPVIDCGNITDIETNSCAALNYPLPTATDNCVVDTIQLIEGLPSGVAFPSGTTIVTYAAIDDCGNSATCSFNVTVNIDLEITTVSTLDVSCPGESDGAISVDVINGGTPPYMVTSSAGSLDNLPAGEYIISVVDANGCTATETVIINEPVPLFFAFGVVDTVSCPGENDGMVLLDTLPDNLSWEFNGDPNMLSAGQYEVTITDAGSGCTSIAEFSVADPDELTLANVAVVDPLCYDSQDCAVLFDAVGGTGNISVTLDPESEYCGSGVTIILEDENGCFYEESFVFAVPDSISVDNELITDSNEGANDGSVEIDVEGGMGSLSYVWTNENGDTISVDQDLLGVAGGIYILEVTDSNGCQKLYEYTVGTITSTVDLDPSDLRIKLYPNPASDIINIEFIEERPQSIELIDIAGKQIKLIRTIQSGSQTIDMTDIESGLYLVRIAYEEDIVLKRISKI